MDNCNDDDWTANGHLDEFGDDAAVERVCDLWKALTRGIFLAFWYHHILFCLLCIAGAGMMTFSPASDCGRTKPLDGGSIWTCTAIAGFLVNVTALWCIVNIILKTIDLADADSQADRSLEIDFDFVKPSCESDCEDEAETEGTKAFLVVLSMVVTTLLRMCGSIWGLCAFCGGNCGDPEQAQQNAQATGALSA